MKKEDLLAVLRLKKCAQIGDTISKKLISLVGSPSGIFEEKSIRLQKIDGIGERLISNLSDERNLSSAERELEFILNQNIDYSYFLDADYPEYLKHCPDGPVLFFKRGKINFDKRPVIAIVGTRNMTLYGRDFCKELIQHLKDYNPIIVSGFAYGVDICAHQEAIKHNLQTIAVLASGLQLTYPKGHIKYVSEVEDNGGFISEFYQFDQPFRENFLRRNRIIAGLSQATVVIESGEKGGSLVTADIANSYNRDVFAVPGRVTDMFSKGCNSLIKQNRAIALTDPDDVVQMLNWDIEPNTAKKPIQKQLFVELSDEQQSIVDFLNENGKELLDIISLKTSIPIYKLSPLLLELELKGIVKPLPGKQFELC